jgi:hypothetical protein
MSLEPLRQGLGHPIRQEGDRLPALQIDQHCTIGLAFPQAKSSTPRIVRVGSAGTGCQRSSRKSGCRLTRRSHAAEAYPSFVAQGDAEGREALDEPQRVPGPGRSHHGQALGEDTARAIAIAAELFAHPEL